MSVSIQSFACRLVEVLQTSWQDVRKTQILLFELSLMVKRSHAACSLTMS